MILRRHKNIGRRTAEISVSDNIHRNKRAGWVSILYGDPMRNNSHNT
jgi:hypothetical protein